MKAALESASSEQKEMYANHGRFAKTIEKVRLSAGWRAHVYAERLQPGGQVSPNDHWRARTLILPCFALFAFFVLTGSRLGA